MICILIKPIDAFYPKLDTCVQFEVTSFIRGAKNGIESNVLILTHTFISAN